MRLIAFCLVLAVASPVSAETFDLAGHTVTIDLPAGFCPLDRDHPMDREIFAVTEDVNTTSQYLIQAAPCQNLERWHQGRSPTLNRYMNSVTPLSDGEPMSVGTMARDRFLQEMKNTLPDVDLEEIQSEVDEMYSGNPDLSVEGIQLLGVVAEDENAIYIALVATIGTDLGETTAATVWAATVLNSVVIFVYLADDMTPDIHGTLAAELAPYMAELVRRNP